MPTVVRESTIAANRADAGRERANVDGRCVVF